MNRMSFRSVLLSTVLVASSANAMFVGNYDAWKKFSPQAQEVYLIGVMDAWTRTAARGEPAWVKIERTGINKCVKEQGIGSVELAELVNSHYKKHSADWRVPPAVVLKDVVVATCLADINGERKKAGLPPWERKPEQISSDSE